MLPGIVPGETESRLHHRLRARRRAHRPRVRVRAALRRPRPRARARAGAARSSRGGFSFVLMDDAHLIGVRDPHGFWPLVLGRLERRLGARERDRRARHRRRALRARGRARRDGRDRRVGRAQRARSPNPTRSSACSSSSTSRVPTPCSTATACTRRASAWVRSWPARRRSHADMVMPVPESGIPAAQGYAARAGIPYGDGLVKNRYVGRTFIQPNQKQRGPGRAAEAQPAAGEHPGQEARRGRRLDRARHHHASRSCRCCARPARPRCTSACRRRRTSGRASTAWTPASRSELLAADLSVGEIRDFLGVDSLAYLELDRLTARHRRVARLVLHRVPLGRRTRCRCRSPTPSSRSRTTPRPPSPPRLDDGAEPDDRRTADVRGRGRRHRRRRTRRRAHQGARALDVPARGRRRHRRVRRALRVRRPSVRAPAARVVDRRRRHEVAHRAPHRSLRHDRHRPRRDVGRRHRGAGRRAAVLPRLHLDRQARPRDRRRHRRRRRATDAVEAGLRAARWRDVGAPRPDGAGRVRPRRVRGRRRRARRGAAARR